LQPIVLRVESCGMNVIVSKARTKANRPATFKHGWCNHSIPVVLHLFPNVRVGDVRSSFDGVINDDQM